MQKYLTILELQGNLTLVNNNQSLEAIKNAIKPGTIAVLLDVKQLGFVDSAGLATLVRLYKLTQAMGTRLALCAPPPQLLQLLQMTSMDSFFETFESRENFYESWVSQFPVDASVESLDSLSITTIPTD